MHLRPRHVALAAFTLSASTLVAVFASGPTPVGAIARYHRPIVALDANQSNNWSGYNQGTLEKGNKLFTSMTGDWTVPTATQHTPGEAEYSSSWIGIGGGCVDAGCTVTDNTLIQLGTEQDVDTTGAASYSAWWEIIPAPSVNITAFTVHPGDQIHATLNATVPGLWTMTMKDLTSGSSFSQTIPYPSSMLTAEWIEETPVIIGSGSAAGLGALPNLGTVHFDAAQTNGANAQLTAAEEMQLADANGNPLATPSTPDVEADGFNDCTHSSTCVAP
jgi:hypothetical protein